jgi:inhibitor of cysteine peptidase
MQKQLAIILSVFVVASAVTASVSALLISSQVRIDLQDKMPAFASSSDLAKFLDSANAKNGYWNYSPGTGMSQGANQDMSYFIGSPDYSKTNVRTEGVDEIDTVKTHGEYIYSSTWNSVRIIRAYPPSDLAIASFINSSDLTSILNSTDIGVKDSNEYLSMSVNGLYLTADKLVIIASVSVYRYYYGGGDVIYPNSSDPNSSTPGNATSLSIYAPWTPEMQKTVVFVFGIGDPYHPSFETFFAATGYPITSRLQDGFLYSLSESYIWKSDVGVYQLPKITVDGKTSEVAVKDIHYDPEASDPSYFLNIMAIDLSSGDAETKSIIGGWSSVIYKSQDSLFLTFEKWNWQDMPIAIMSETAAKPLVTTTIYKIAVIGLTMAVTARGDFSGVLLNQFALDEKDGYLRLAANNGDRNHRLNAVYILDSDLAIIGSLENLAANESVQAARFVGDTLYLVTFRRVDPLFVIDLSTPTAPRIMGELTIPGFSTYLHPIDGGHLLGIGRENSSVKISIYDVSDPTNPLETDKYIVAGYSSTPADSDYKAVLFSAEKNLLVIPIHSWSYDDGNYTSRSGFYVFTVSPQSGIALRGIIDQDGRQPYYYGNARVLFIGEYLYSITDGSVGVNAISSLSAVGSLELPTDYGYYYIYSAARVLT